MSRSIFGWSYPPGCSGPPEDSDSQCDICGQWGDSCICPECPVCNDFGNPDCYARTGRGVKKDHGLKVTKAQLLSRQKARIADSQERLSDERCYLQWLEEQPDSYTEELPPAPLPPTPHLSLTRVLDMLESLQKAIGARRVTDRTLRDGLACLPGVDRYYDGKLEAYAMMENDIKNAIAQVKKETEGR